MHYDLLWSFSKDVSTDRGGNRWEDDVQGVHGEEDDDRGMLGGSDDGPQDSEGRASVDDEHLSLRHIPLFSDPKLP